MKTSCKNQSRLWSHGFLMVKKSKAVPFYSPVLLAMIVCSCSPVLYTNVGQNVPLFHDKGEVAASVAVGGTEYTSGISAQGALSLDKNWLVMTSLYAHQNNGSGIFTTTTGTGNGTYFELGGGKFNYNSETKICTELVAGVGFGSIHNSISSEFVNVNYFKPFIQPSAGISTKFFELALTPRIGLVNYTSKSSSLSDVAEQVTLEDFYTTRKNTFVFEPGITLPLGFKNVKLQAQYNYSTFDYPVVSNFYSSAFNNFRPVDKTFFSIGLSFMFGRLVF